MRSILRGTALIDTWFDMLPVPQRAPARALHALVVESEPALAPTVKWGNLVYQLDGGHLLALAAHKAHLNLQVFNGAQLEASFPELEGTGRGMRHLKCRTGVAPDGVRIRALVRASAQAARGGRAGD